MNNFLKFLKAQTVIFTFYLFLFSILGFLSQFYYIFDIFSHFRFQYYVLGLIFLFILVILHFSKRIKVEKYAFFLCIIVLIINFTQINPYTGSKTGPLDSEIGIKIEFMNVLTSNQRHDLVLKNIKKVNPDILFLQEVNQEWLKNLSELEKIYPYSIKETREDNFGVALYSKIPLVSTQIIYLGNYYLPAIDSIIEVKGKKVRIIALHTIPPSSQENFICRNNMIDEVSHMIRHTKIPTIVIGDLNTTMYATTFKNFVKSSKLENPRLIYGIKPTWIIKTFLSNNYDNNPEITMLPIDHLLNTSEIIVTSFETETSIGSDHLPIVGEIRLKQYYRGF